MYKRELRRTQRAIIIRKVLLKVINSLVIFFKGSFLPDSSFVVLLHVSLRVYNTRTNTYGFNLIFLNEFVNVLHAL